MFIWVGFLTASGRIERGLRDLIVLLSCFIFLEEETEVPRCEVSAHVCPVSAWGEGPNQGSFSDPVALGLGPAAAREPRPLLRVCFCLPGRLGGPPGLRGALRKVLPGRHRELGNRLCRSPASGGVRPSDQAA